MHAHRIALPQSVLKKKTSPHLQASAKSVRTDRLWQHFTQERGRSSIYVCSGSYFWAPSCLLFILFMQLCFLTPGSCPVQGSPHLLVTELLYRSRWKRKKGPKKWQRLVTEPVDSSKIQRHKCFLQQELLLAMQPQRHAASAHHFSVVVKYICNLFTPFFFFKDC